MNLNMRIISLLFLAIHVRTQTITNLYMSTTNSFLNSGRDGYLIAQLVTGENTTICNYRFSDANANVACLTLGYPPSGLSISRPSSSIPGPVLIGDIRCTGNETNLNMCISSGRKVFGSPCSSHNLDAYLFCLQPKVAPQIPTNTAITPCNKTSGSFTFLPVVNMVNTGFLLSGTNYICNTDFSFGAIDASNLCKLFCNSVVSPQITQFQTGVPATATYVKMSAFPYTVSPPITPGCPTQTLSLQCAPEPVLIETSPNVTCNTQTITATWNTGFQPTISKSLIALAQTCGSGTPQIDSNSSFDAFIAINFTSCSPIPTASTTSITYSYILTRSYVPSSSGLISTSPRNLTISCIFPKADSSNQNISIETATASYLKSSFSLDVIMDFYSDQSFTSKLVPDANKIYYVYDTGMMFVKVTLQSTVPTLRLGLVNCKFATVKTMEETNDANSISLITDSCASTVANYKMALYSLDRKNSGFGFQPYVLGGVNSIYVLCETTKCYVDTPDGNCLTCNPTGRKKRSVLDTETVVLGPVIIL